MSYIGHPILNDDKYGDFKMNKIFYNTHKYKYQMLHSYKITFSSLDGILEYLSNKVFIAPLKNEELRIINSIFPDYKLH
jgi:23S rRNA pseudouridine955/2504/2580 synthase